MCIRDRRYNVESNEHARYHQQYGSESAEVSEERFRVLGVSEEYSAAEEYEPDNDQANCGDRLESRSGACAKIVDGCDDHGHDDGYEAYGNVYIRSLNSPQTVSYTHLSIMKSAL